jgi:hypothetical protein
MHGQTACLPQVGTSRMDGSHPGQLARKCRREGMDARTEPWRSDPFSIDGEARLVSRRRCRHGC